ncbi:MAG TPA: exodeoxyribonuclease VII small subunit [Lachnoclostridium phytofermentans]|uniref:Exodeoxyribonuclease 7 small subunit n=2 Tax=Lachnoclostridium TaxID=1506553 RepID=A0A3D2X4Q8_9FIRM|nr:exodeoxyribonuclease VII small subunit [Lachnoclostridium phytofermentans]
MLLEVKMAGKSKGLEKSLEQLNDILANLEKEDISLEESFTLYQEGMKLLKQCNESIDKVEKQLIILEEEGEV